ncbi:hypothetical protein ASPZODRAFT_153814 [Penicilliopsis zonata CBS 506.65]|uniref:Indoleamine 2,3-dioxygenase n=1 Tax=Penicilliopsis zonata CBS 506.65 TaxID=1073090 RepID=A0A1L9SB38_9EURO|nr:hypothetical protein ASPZODRAFT_153814 [Penicilliopsis zonata CBS 506.65]OJJ44356.1 hypothetical protein ASPZODRAFT_153814 [Penicilliopsis zonata CBS 506.65]
MLPPIPVLADYGISPDHGFLPSELPLVALPDPYYAKWEAIVSNLQALLLSKRIRSTVDRLPVLSTSYLYNENEWRRAYVVLTFILHGYVWGGDRPEEVIPPQITTPLLQVCEHLEVPPVATYASVCLWNYKPIFPDEPADTLENLASINTFTGSLDEHWFYLVSVAIESRGAPSIPLMLQAIAAARAGNSEVVTKCLQALAEVIDDVCDLFQRVYENCDPHVFYHRIRPYLAGSKNMADAGLPNGLLYDDGTGKKTEYRQYGGGSNAQSSLIQFFDIVLGVDHRPTGVTKSDTAVPSSQPRHNFIHEMREYMPGPHRRFLEHVNSVANIQAYVKSHQSDRVLCIAYDACLAMLRNLRDKHIQIVSRYIVVKSREARSQSSSVSNGLSMNRPGAMNLATVHHGDSSSNKKLRGTGGTALIPFLKQARDETGEPAINSWAKRLLTNGPGKPAFASTATDNSSTLKSYIDQGTGYAQRIIGSVTGNSSQETAGAATHEQGKAEQTASHTTAKLGPVTVDPNTGATATDDPNRSTGQWDQTVGSAKESLGNLIGNDSLRRAGQEQNAAGKEQEARGQLKDWSGGVTDRAAGALGSVGAAIVGDREEEQKWRDVHDEGKTRQRGAEADIQRRA